VDDSRRRGSQEAIGGLRSASGVPAVPNDVRSGDWPFFPASRHTPSVVMMHPTVPVLRWGWPWSQSDDQPQDFLEQFLRHRDLGHLEDDVAVMAHDLGADLHEFFPQAGQRPLLDRLGQSQRPHEVGEIVGQRMKLKPDGMFVNERRRIAEVAIATQLISRFGQLRRFVLDAFQIGKTGLVPEPCAQRADMRLGSPSVQVRRAKTCARGLSRFERDRCCFLRASRGVRPDERRRGLL